MTSTNSDELTALILRALTQPHGPFTQVIPAGGNVGNGSIRDFSLSPGVLVGDYAVLIVDPGTAYTVTDPNGTVLATGGIGQFAIGQDPIGGGSPVGGYFNVPGSGIGFQVFQGTVPFQVGDAFVVRTVYPTGAGKNVFAPRDWPASTDLYPMLKLSSPKEIKTSLGPNGPQFNTVTTVRVTGSLTAKPEKKDAGAGICQAALGILQRQIEVAVINNYELFLVIQEMETVDIDNSVVDKGELHVGELTMDFSMKFPQGPEDFAPPDLMTITGMDVFGDLVTMADPSGTYTPPMNYEPTPAPRVIGPDGRVEGAVSVELES